MANYTKSIFKGSLIVLFFTVLTGGLHYLLRILLARSLTKVEYGLFYAVFGFVSLFGFLRDLGFKGTLAKYIPEFLIKKQYWKIKSSIQMIILTQILIAGIVMVILLFFSDYLAINFFKESLSYNMLIILIISFFFFVFYLIFFGIFQGYQNMFLFSLLEFFHVLFFLGFSYILLKNGIGGLAPAYAYLISTLFCIVLFFILFYFNIYLKDLKIKSKFSKQLYKSLFKYSLFIFLNVGAMNIIGMTDTVLLTYLKGMNAVADYNVAYPVARLVSMISSSLVIVLLPMVSMMWAKNQKHALSEGIERLVKMMFLVILPVVVLFFAFPEIIIRLLFGEQYVVASNILRVLLLGFVFVSLFILLGTVLNGIGKPRLVNYLAGLGMVVNVILNYFFIIQMGALGAAIATTISYFLMFFMSIYYTEKEILIKFPFKKIFLIGFSSLMMLIVISVIKFLLILNPWFELIISIGIAGIVYLLCIFMFKIITISEIFNILNRVLDNDKK